MHFHYEGSEYIEYLCVVLPCDFFYLVYCDFFYQHFFLLAGKNLLNC